MLTAGLWCCPTFTGRFAWCWWSPRFSSHFARHAYRAHTHTRTHTHTSYSSDGCIQTAAPSSPACVIVHCVVAQLIKKKTKKQLNGLCGNKNTGSDRRAACSRAVLSVSLLADNKVETCQSVMALSCTQDDICITYFLPTSFFGRC